MIPVPLNYEQRLHSLAAKWGSDKSIDAALEELNELAVALHHYKRDKVTKGEVLEEMADVRLAIDHLTFHIGNYFNLLEGKLKKGEVRIN